MKRSRSTEDQIVAILREQGRHRRADDAELRAALRRTAATHRRFSHRRLHVILRRDGHVLNRKRTRRHYREEGLSVRRRRSRKRAMGTRAPWVTEAMARARWSVDFMQDRFADRPPQAIWGIT
jgi:putative transposase